MADSETYTGGMIALVPSAHDAARLAVDGGLPEEDLHTTLVYLGDDAAVLGSTDRLNLIEAAAQVARNFGELRVDGFAIDVFNPDGEDPCIVVGLGGEPLDQAHDLLLGQITADIPDQKKPWIPHITLIYTSDFSLVTSLVDRVGPVTFDRIRVAFGMEHIDIPLAGEVGNKAVDLPQPVDDAHGIGAEGIAFVESQYEVGALDHEADEITAAVNTTGWQRLPVADRDTVFQFREATDRLASHADSIAQFSSWFFWRDPSKPANNRNSYRMPFADVFDDGTVKLVPSAVFSAAAQLAGAHGALPIIPDAEKDQIRQVIGRIYDKFRDMWNDPRQVPPWDRPPGKSAADKPVKEETASIDDDDKDEDMPVNLVDDDIPIEVAEEEDDLRAAIAPLKPPAAWFANPQLTKPTRLRFEESGRVYGHIAQFGTCHRGYGDRCVRTPHSATNYAHFKTGTVLTDDEQLRTVGILSMNTGHAMHGLDAAAAIAHYNNTGNTAAILEVGEDAYGIWVAGMVSPNVTPEQVVQLRAAPPSGDWRPIGGSLELVNVLAVITPGLPVDEPQYALNASGEILSLTAAGVVEEDCGCDGHPTDEELAAVADGRAQKIMEAAAARDDRMRERRATMLSSVKLRGRG